MYASSERARDRLSAFERYISSFEMKLISIKGSHYVERARWALDLARIPYEEDCYPPVIHMPATRHATRGGSSKGSSSSSVPILITPGSVLADSLHIVKYCHEQMGDASCLYPTDEAQLKEIEDIELLCASKLGVFARVVLYQHAIFTDSHLTVEVLCQGVPYYRRLAFRSLYYLIVPLMKVAMKVNKENAEACLAKVECIMAELSTRLTKAGGRFFVGDKFSAADLTFASMTALLVIPPANYGLDLSLIKEPLFRNPRIAALRETVAGKHCLRMFEEHREVTVALPLESKM